MATGFEKGEPTERDAVIMTADNCNGHCANGEATSAQEGEIADTEAGTESETPETDNAMLDKSQPNRVVINEHIKVKNVSAVQVGYDNTIRLVSTAESQDPTPVGATVSLPAASRPSPDQVLVYHRKIDIENCDSVQVGNNNSMVIEKVSTPQADGIPKICLDLGIDPKKEDIIFKRLSDATVLKKFSKMLADESNRKLTCSIRSATKGCILLELEVPTEADRLQLIRMVRDGTFQKVFLETFLPELAAEGMAVNMNLAIGVRNPSQAMMEEVQGAVASSNHEKFVVVPLAAPKQDQPESTEDKSSKLSDDAGDLAEALQGQLNLEMDSKGTDQDNETPLWTAAQQGNLPTIQMLIEEGADVNMEDEGGRTSVWAASKGGHAAVVEILISKGADVNKADKKGRTPLWVAAQNNHVSIVELLISKGADVNMADKEGRSPIWVASQNGHIPTIEMLLSKGADVNLADKDGRSPLWVAAQKDDNLSTVELLINKSAKVNMADGDGRTSLWVAAQNGCFSTVKLLISRGAAVDMADEHRQTPLWVASQGGHLPTVEFLLSKGAGINTIDEDDQTPLWIASQEGHLPVVETLLHNGADVNKADKDNQPPLWIASQEGHLPVVDRLLRKGADVNVADVDHQTPLSVAAQWDHRPVVEMLLSKGADVNMADKDGRTPLWIAALKGHLPTVNMLLSKGADVNMADNHDKTPLWIALQYGQHHTAEVLRSYGAHDMADNTGGTLSTYLHLSIRNRYMRKKGDADNADSGPTDVAKSMNQSNVMEAVH